MLRQPTHHGYIEVFLGKDHHLADARGWAYEHRYVMEQKLRRRLRPGEEVHHRDRNRQNNARRNLRLAGSQAEHQKMHRSGKTWRRDPGEDNLIISCECGCGTAFPRYNKQGLARQFKPGHNSRNKPHRDDGKLFLRRSHNAGKTHCPNGHAYDDENTRITKSGRRKCRTCHRIREKERRDGDPLITRSL